jgi:hypothetical protein
MDKAKLTASINDILNLNPCNSGEDRLMRYWIAINRDKEILIEEYLKSNTMSDVCWLLGKMNEKQILVSFAKKCADSVAHLESINSGVAAAFWVADADASADADADASAAAAAASAAADAAADAADAAAAAASASAAASAAAASAAAAYRTAKNKQLEKNQEFLIEIIRQTVEERS